MPYAIMVREHGSDREVELCRVGTNPDAVVKAVKQKSLFAELARKKAGRCRLRIAGNQLVYDELQKRQVVPRYEIVYAREIK